ncbi:MAG: hypothetical protein OEM80_06160 [Desulfobulbaceae bacterium]|jgi:hypothetical protein|nr:hypothetical protein [Desulfobulbaceae bacterium]MDH3783152.1 hypothetical protein [Desulfobulbaceae bacterium]PLX51572.1 MAG: hypothetical protein C0612_05510 [Desulfobulbaceae bacterium]HKJ13743.1 hypothetical protein [Desulfobulbales bacterium]
MSEEYEIKYSTLCQKVTSEGKSVQVYIYEDGKGGWILEVVDEYDNSTVWDDPFKTDDEALDEVFDTIEKEGISSLIGTENDYLH